MEKSPYPVVCKVCGAEGVHPYFYCEKHLEEEQKDGMVLHRFDRSADPTTDTSGTYKVGQTVLVCVDDQYRTGDIIRIAGDVAVIQMAGDKRIERELKSLVHLRASTLARARRGAERRRK